MARQGRTWDQYPLEYMEFMDKLNMPPHELLLPVRDHIEAQTLRRDLYRWYHTLQRAAPRQEIMGKRMPFDDQAFHYLQIARCSYLQVVESAPGEWALRIRQRPYSTLPSQQRNRRAPLGAAPKAPPISPKPPSRAEPIRDASGRLVFETLDDVIEYMKQPGAPAEGLIQNKDYILVPRRPKAAPTT